MKNFVLPDKFLPTGILNSDLKFTTTAKLMGKVKDVKGMVHLYTVKCFGEIQKDKILR